MEKLFHLSTTPRQLDMFDADWNEIAEFVKKNNMDGIELGLTIDYDINRVPKHIIEGVHLSFYPMWIDFWKEDKDKLSKLFNSNEEIVKYYRTDSKQQFIDNYRKEYERAKSLEAKYMVFHVSHVLPEDSFIFKYDYTDKEILDYTIELVNEVFLSDDDGPLLLFENLWWPGLTYTDSALTKYFIESINYKNKGYLVDVSHLTLTNPKIKNEFEVYKYISKVIKDLGTTASYIKGVHLNKTLPKFYMQRDHLSLLERYKSEKDPRKKLMILKNHIKNMDGHQPFDNSFAKKILDVIKPEFCVFETAPQDRYELAYFIKKQNQALQT